MSTSLLHHTFGIRSMQHIQTDFLQTRWSFTAAFIPTPYLGRKRKFITIAMDLETGRVIYPDEPVFPYNRSNKVHLGYKKNDNGLFVL